MCLGRRRTLGRVGIPSPASRFLCVLGESGGVGGGGGVLLCLVLVCAGMGAGKKGSNEQVH
jgi:hypothetical protein